MFQFDEFVYPLVVYYYNYNCKIIFPKANLISINRRKVKAGNRNKSITRNHEPRGLIHLNNAPASTNTLLLQQSVFLQILSFPSINSEWIIYIFSFHFAIFFLFLVLVFSVWTVKLSALFLHFVHAVCFLNLSLASSTKHL